MINSIFVNTLVAMICSKTPDFIEKTFVKDDISYVINTKDKWIEVKNKQHSVMLKTTCKY